jgi:hypothetical protein
MGWSYDNPDKPGKYVVQTKSTVLKTIHTLSAQFSNDKWSFKNQVFYRYLKE